MPHLKILLSLVVLTCSGQPLAASIDGTPSLVSESAAPSGRILRHGIFSKVSGGQVIESSETSTGKSLSKLVMTFIREIDRIPIKKDTILGYQYRLSNLPDAPSVQLRRVLKHPQFRLPDGTLKSGSDFVITRRVERGEVFGYDVYALNEGYEMVEGEWIFQLYFGDRLLTEQRFVTFHPGPQAIEKSSRLENPDAASAN